MLHVVCNIYGFLQANKKFTVSTMPEEVIILEFLTLTWLIASNWDSCHTFVGSHQLVHEGDSTTLSAIAHIAPYNDKSSPSFGCIINRLVHLHEEVHNIYQMNYRHYISLFIYISVLMMSDSEPCLTKFSLTCYIQIAKPVLHQFLKKLFIW